jgi:hypothetical protein
MASKKAKRWLASIGQPIAKVHTSLELANFSAGTGNKTLSLPYQIIQMTDATGDSKATVGHAKTLADARADANRIMDGHGIENERSRFAYYIRDIRNGRIFRP